MSKVKIKLTAIESRTLSEKCLLVESVSEGVISRLYELASQLASLIIISTLKAKHRLIFNQTSFNTPVKPVLIYFFSR